MDTALPTREAMHGLSLPPDIAFVPATPAWYVLFAALGLLALWLAWRGWCRWRAAAYRREARRLVLAAERPEEVAGIVKRTALAAWPRERVAALSGEAWAAFLRRTAPRARIAEDAALGLATASWSPAPPPMDALRATATAWIRHHDLRV